MLPQVCEEVICAAPMSETNVLEQDGLNHSTPMWQLNSDNSTFITPSYLQMKSF